MKAIFVLGSLEPNAVKWGKPLTARTTQLLQDLADGAGVDDVEIVFAIQDEFFAGRDKGKIGIQQIRDERPRVLSEISQAKPDFVMAFGPVAAASLFGRGNVTETELLRKVHYPLVKDGPPVYYTFSLENVRRAHGLRQWLELDMRAAINGWTKTEWGDYQVLHPQPNGYWTPLKQSTGPLLLPDYFPYIPDPVIGFDTETYPGLDYYDPHARVRMCQVSDKEGRAWVVQLTPDSRVPEWLERLLVDPRVKKVGSNIKYDYKWMRRFGIRMRNMECTIVREHLIDQSNPKKDLKSLTFKYLPRLGDYSSAQMKRVKELGGWEHLTDKEQYQYAAADAEASIATYRGQEAALLDRKNAHSLLTDLYPVLAEMEFQGACIDEPENRKLDKLYKEKLRETRTKIAAVLGPINLNSPTQLAKALKAVVPTIDLNLKDLRRAVSVEEGEEVSTKRMILERESHKHPVIKHVLEFRKYRTRHSTFIESMYEKFLSHHHGKSFLHASYRSDLVATYRLSCQGPNLMNIPTKDYDEPLLSIKRQFISRFKGGKMLEVDQSQVEIRFAAWASQDRQMLAAILSGQDIHTAMAGRLLNKDPKDVTEQERYECKTKTFLIMYGGGAKRLAEELLQSDVSPRHVTKKEAWGMIQEYFRAFHGLKDFIDRTHKDVRKTLEVVTDFGFHRRFAEPDYWEGPEGWSVQRQAFNTLVQNGAACLTYCAMIWLHNALETRNMQSKMVLQVHDSLLLDVYPGEEQQVAEMAKFGMEFACIEEAKKYGVDFTVPLTADVSIGESWGDLKTYQLP